ncbi:helix-turn-helix domain-containing protein [Microbacterium karelineae]|uniref:helix-turn-helix domain-containing protein n=1 Tax=Microbacterium karelineae TaxID=2654283 RepID=UPI0012EA957A|nr:helix-turn-helix transcriptional regulator [Microbacterium karelineae]
MHASNDDRLSRPRLVSMWQRVAPGATVLVTAQHRSGVASSIREWLAGSGASLVVWSSNRTDVPAEAPDADVVLLELEGMRDDHVTATLAVRDRWPAATLIAVSSTQWPPGLLDAGLRPERVFSGALFGFTAEEVLDRAAQLGLSLSWDTASALLDRVGTHAGFVDAVLRAAGSRGSLDDVAVRTGCDEATSHFASSAAAGVFRPNGWRALLVTARIGPMPRRTLLAVWGQDEVVRAALDNILQSGFFTHDLTDDTIELRPDIRAAVIERIEREARVQAVDEAVAALASRLLSEGDTREGWAVVADLPGARTRLLARHWWQLGEFDVDRARPWLDEAVQRDPDPVLRLALARALIDVTCARHSGSVPRGDRLRASLLLDELDAADLDPDARFVADMLRGILPRLEGRFAEALEIHERLADGTAGSPGPHDAAPCGLVQASALIQAGLSALDAYRRDIASDRFAAAAALAHQARHERLATFAHEMLLVVRSNGAPIASPQSRIDDLVGAQVSSRPLQSIVALSSALYVVDPRALQDALDAADDAPPLDDPITLRFVSVTLRSIAHSLLGTSNLAIRRLELFERGLAGHELSMNHRALLLWARTEALLPVGAEGRAIALLAEAPADLARVIPVDILRARAHLRARAPERALACLATAPETRETGVLAVWAHVLLFLAYHAIGSESSAAVAREHLSTAIVTASRARPLLPFAMQGTGALSTIIAQSAEIALDPAGRRLVGDLVRVRDALQVSTGAPLTLSERERTVVAHLAVATSTKDLAQRLHVSPNTVKTQLRSIYRKLDVSSWADAVATAKRLGLAE